MLNVGFMTLSSLALETTLKSLLDAIYIITKETDKGHVLPCADQRLVFDVDTPKDYQLLLTDKEKTK